ncbi:Lipopolysaccharide-modifying protein [Cynara cardunculus var. scolymus]|uniref:Lipopolysaccharide-modifying protein n=1 Tax=Cynara cardunculus var. scolymus TaxID=59895 RepID=A0A124SFY4_CYNCS|nr:Lipopolysaccharide-modifying protein [Cynara cardunculus var. scolymus]
MQPEWYNEGISNSVWGSRSKRFFRYFSDTICLPLLSAIMTATSRSSVRLLFFLLFMFVAAFLSTRLIDATNSVTSVAENPSGSSVQTTTTVHTEPTITQVISKKPPKKIEIPLNCSLGNLARTCPADYYPKIFKIQDLEYTSEPPHECPEYFRWIHEDLKPWKETGITEEMVERAKRTANFRLVILNGRAYVETYQKSFQSRDVFTLWGILQLLRRYPGKVPDLDLMFDCVDWPVILKKFYRRPNAVAPPPLFRYCSDDSTLDIVFPDWSFWGWPEINIRPWGSLLKDLEEGNMRTKWIDREPYAYWKGNPVVAETRMDLLKCNVSEKEDWNARVFAQDWFKESQQGYKQSDLASQCVHRQGNQSNLYKIYIEGSAWSVSDKYILACDSVTFVVKPRYYDFFTRGLMPVHHYWPIKEDDKCRSIKFAVDWGNNHKKKLLKYKPQVPEKAAELCSEAMACSSQGFEKQFMMESMIKGPAAVHPCTMPPPYEPQALKSLLRRKTNSILQVEKWEKGYFENQNNKP